MRFILAAVISFILLIGCDNSAQRNEPASAYQPIAKPRLDEALILSGAEFKPVKKYNLEDGHGFYMQQSPDAAIEFRNNPPRINVSIRTYPEASYEEKNAAANEIAKTLISIITGTDGQLIDDVVAGRIRPGKQFINGLPVNVSGMEHHWLITVAKQ